MELPKISIITITFNSEKTLEETIESVLSQNYPNLEYLIIDGGSSDGTLEIVKRYKDKIDFVISEPDRGISDAFNKGIRYATGEIVGIINSDDLLLPDALHKVAENYDSNVGVYRGNTVIWNDKTGSKLVAIPSMSFSVYSFKRRKICHQSTFILKSTYNNFGAFRTDFKYMMDADLLIRFYRNKVKFKYIDANLAVFRLGGVTDTSFIKKLPEVRNLYRGNGANIIFTLWKMIESVSFGIGKKILFAFSGDKLKKLRYNK
ncbi:glycosyltransferase family 2 protein [Bacteroides salyersiae]|uniref:glycosyltransferase family 2 protein n=1 Tax=Bacteroides salyersiae TaxID=291644 RepID=UPI002164F111|nr:glycosyltransferase family 2 protein [Bacteroides salyersiae]MCS3059950.1 glycosyltransferase [Bacteroides salyersiae]